MRPEEQSDLAFPAGFAKGVIRSAKREKRRRQLALVSVVFLAAAFAGGAWRALTPRTQVVIGARAPHATCPWGCASKLTGDGEESLASAGETDHDPFH